ncbi:unnamed protein product [Brassica napus]|uniref:(rape) hypothetical protein n=1 Tax=Brassica napus TaxID=3708 RepID=A0A816P594_BRANA|nr:unnamed protein product [Brassica napus]
MCRPSQTPHLTMSSARIDPPKRVLGLKEGVVTPPPDSRSNRTRVKLNRVFFSPLILPSPFPWLWFRWIVDRDIGFPLSAFQF